jgi:hypothetical protein
VDAIGREPENCHVTGAMLLDSRSDRVLGR